MTAPRPVVQDDLLRTGDAKRLKVAEDPTKLHSSEYERQTKFPTVQCSVCKLIWNSFESVADTLCPWCGQGTCTRVWLDIPGPNPLKLTFSK